MTIPAQTGIDTVLFAPTGITDAATSTANFDCIGADHATVRINFAAEETTDAGTVLVSLLGSDDTIVTNFATITADQSVANTSATELRYEVDLIGQKRYLRLSVTAGAGTGSDLTFSSIGTLTRNDVSPANTTEMGDDTVVIV